MQLNLSDSLRIITSAVMLLTGLLGVFATVSGSEQMFILTLISSLVAFGFFLLFLSATSPER